MDCEDLPCDLNWTDSNWPSFITLAGAIQGASKGWCQRFSALFVLKIPPQRGEGEKREGVQISKNRAQNLWHHPLLEPCTTWRWWLISYERETWGIRFRLWSRNPLLFSSSSITDRTSAAATRVARRMFPRYQFLPFRWTNHRVHNSAELSQHHLPGYPVWFREHTLYWHV